MDELDAQQLNTWQRASLARARWALNARGRVNSLEGRVDALMQSGRTLRAAAHLSRIQLADDLQGSLIESLNAGAGLRSPSVFPYPAWMKRQTLEQLVASGRLNWSRAFFRAVVLDLPPAQRRVTLDASPADRLLDIYAYRVWAGLEPPIEVTAADLDLP